MKAKILIVEDEFVLYDEMADFLSANDYGVANYTKSYKEAIDQIIIYNPDLVLLDINLDGAKDGIDLGEELNQKYHIPFIYITSFDDEVTLNRALRTKPSHFIAKAKPNLDFNQLLIDIKLVLNKVKQEEHLNKKGIFVLKDYLNEMKDLQTTSGDFLTNELIEFDDIVYFSREPYLKNKKDKNKAEVKTNYIRVVTSDNYCFFYYGSLTNLLKKLPHYFIRISDKTIVNIAPKYLDGKIKSNKIAINGKVFTISTAYKKNVNNLLCKLYEM